MRDNFYFLCYYYKVITYICIQFRKVSVFIALVRLDVKLPVISIDLGPEQMKTRMLLKLPFYIYLFIYFLFEREQVFFYIIEKFDDIGWVREATCHITAFFCLNVQCKTFKMISFFFFYLLCTEDPKVLILQKVGKNKGSIL